MVDFDLGGQTLTAVRVEYSAGLTFTGGYFVLIQGRFALATAGEVRNLCSEADGPQVARLLQTLVGVSLASSSISDTGALALAFCDGSTLAVEPDGQYEAWNASGPNRLLVVCLPSGGLAVWDADETAL